MAQFTKDELKAKIQALESAGEKELANKYRAELAKIDGNSSTGSPIAGDLVLNMGFDEWEKAGSKFASPGLHESVFGMPYWKTPGQSLAFPFTIKSGEDEGKEGVIFCGVTPSAAFKIKEILKALNIQYRNQGGMPAINPSEVAGKTGMTLWAQQADSRSADEGGKGNIYCKPISVHPAGSTLQSINVTMKSLLVGSDLT